MKYQVAKLTMNTRFFPLHNSAQAKEKQTCVKCELLTYIVCVVKICHLYGEKDFRLSLHIKSICILHYSIFIFYLDLACSYTDDCTCMYVTGTNSVSCSFHFLTLVPLTRLFLFGLGIGSLQTTCMVSFSFQGHCHAKSNLSQMVHPSSKSAARLFSRFLSIALSMTNPTLP